MKPLSPHDPRNDALDDLIAAALHGELTPEERTQFEARLSTDPAAQAAYQKAQAMHATLEQNYQSAQPDPAFEQRMISGVRRKLQREAHRETAWESLLALWMGLKKFFVKRRAWEYAVVCLILAILGGVAFGPITNGIRRPASVFTTINDHLAMAGSAGTDAKDIREFDRNGIATAGSATLKSGAGNLGLKGSHTFSGAVTLNGGTLTVNDSAPAPGSKSLSFNGGTTLTAGTMSLGLGSARADTLKRGNVIGGNAGSNTVGSIAFGAIRPAYNEPSSTTTSQGGTVHAWGFASPSAPSGPTAASSLVAINNAQQSQVAVDANKKEQDAAKAGEMPADETAKAPQGNASRNGFVSQNKALADTVLTKSGEQGVEEAVKVFPYPAKTSNSPGTPAPAATEAPAIDTRKLIRNAQLDLEVKGYQAAMDQITSLTKAAGGYVDTSHSEKGGNGKLQGTVVVKVLPQNLDAFLLKLRDLGQVQNQSVGTEDVTKEYFDTQARLENSRRMETQLQELLKHANSKVSDLLQVERELGRVRGDIEQMQGQLKLYDFQVQYATVTMQVHEKDLHQAAAYLLKEQDEFSLFATDVEGTFQKARQSAEDFKAQILVANLVHNSGSDVAAELTVMVAPDQIESFLAQIRGLGRVSNFTRQTQRVAKDGGDSDEPADQALTERDKVQVHLSIRSDDETRKQVALTVVAKAVDDALDQAKAAALANAGAEILNSSLNKTPEGQSTAQLTVRVPGKEYSGLIAAFNGLGRAASLSIQRNDNAGPGANGDDAPVIVSLALTDEDTPLQQTEVSVVANDVDQQAQQIKKSAATAGVEVKASSFERQPNGMEVAQMTFRLPMSKYAAFVESVKLLGKVESLSVRRDDRPDQTRTDDAAPAEIGLQLHNQGELVPDNSGLWATVRQTFVQGAAALFGSVRVIGVVFAFLAPWAFTLVLLAWAGRRLYIWRQK